MMKGRRQVMKRAMVSAIVLVLVSSCTSGELSPHLQQLAQLPLNDKMMVEGTACTQVPGTTFLPKKNSLCHG